MFARAEVEETMAPPIFRGTADLNSNLGLLQLS